MKVRTLIDTEKSGVLLGGASNDAALVLRDGAAAAKLISMDANATANALTRTTSPYLFRTSASAWQLSESLGEWAAQHGATEFFVTYVDESFGTESADQDNPENTGCSSTRFPGRLSTTIRGSRCSSRVTRWLEKATVTSPRGRFVFDARHNPVQDIVLLRQVKASANGRLVNTALETASRVSDPVA